MAKRKDVKQIKISKVEATDEKLSSRGGIFFVIRYIENIQFYQLFEKFFGFIKSSCKGLSKVQFIKQLFAYFIDGTDMAMKSFDRRKDDEAYAAVLENTPEEMASSHQIKRFFRKFIFIGNWLFRKILLELFVWRLRIEKPKIIVLFGDSMVLDNNGAEKRQGVEPTYKRKKGFHPVQISWGPYVDAIFRPGRPHCNHGNDFIKAIARLTRAIRERYKDVPIILITDSGFLDDANFRYFEERLKIHYICGGKQYDDLKQYVQQLSPEQFGRYSHERQSWRYVEFGNCLKSWSKFRRCIFTTLETEENCQMQLGFVRTDSFIYTNIGQNQQLTEKLIQVEGEEYLKVEKIISLNHLRGKGELNYRSLKEFATKEQLPFEQFGMNRAYYYLMVISHFLYESYKYDVTSEIIPVTSYPTTFRRQLIDFAAKIVSTGGQFIIKVARMIYENCNISKIWELSGVPPPLFVN